MFALIDLEEANHIALKCDPEKQSNCVNIIRELKGLIILIKSTGIVSALTVT